jgi:hypothetical protein
MGTVFLFMGYPTDISGRAATKSKLKRRAGRKHVPSNFSTERAEGSFPKRPTITVIGKTFFDIGHAPASHSNRRTDLEGYAAREIHPVMNLQIQN